MTAVSLVALSGVAFASTNIDDIFVLVGFFSDPEFRRWQIVAGQALGIGLLVAASLAAAFIAFAISAPLVGLLGFVPLAIGIKKLRSSWLPDGAENESKRPPRGRGKVLAVAGVTIANGGDNLGVYTPLFATQAGWELSVTIAVFAAMTFAWCAAAWLLVSHPTLGTHARRNGHRVLPFVLIGLGAMILYRSGAIGLLVSFLKE
jgi:cadmium resistance protein CadD (predicted permease)